MVSSDNPVIAQIVKKAKKIDHFILNLKRKLIKFLSSNFFDTNGISILKFFIIWIVFGIKKIINKPKKININWDIP